MGNHLALVTDETSIAIDYDMPLLLDACREEGIRAEICSWRDPDIEWDRFDAVLLRSPWSYVESLPQFLDWCEYVTDVTYLFNPLPVVRWNLDKHYLADLAAAGVPVVPSGFVAPGADAAAAVRTFLARHEQAREIVVKPTVGAYSKDVQRFPRSSRAEAAAYVAKLLDQDRHVILQPYLDSVDHHGETDLIHFDGVYSHAIRKRALLLADGTVDEPTQDARTARDAAEDERAVASAALGAAAAHLQLTEPLLYGRVDLIRDADAKPLVLELELCEPSFSMSFSEPSARRFAQVIAVRLEEISRNRTNGQS
ncbi:RimK family alpha-L-glutamate ligase [Streptomyces sp. NPDC051578]|uniref:RimK family alpha-L-glutamate ligase n=1 Tax=Streptomyces sp. NPDC051578 TaxID=3365662 RepID=UPI00379958DC